MSTEARILLYKRTGVPSLTYNLEVWNDLNPTEWERLEKIQGMELKRIMGLPPSTPYWGILKETGTWTVKWQVLYQKMMLFHLMMNSEDSRQAKRILEEQEKRGEDFGFYGNCRKCAASMGVNVKAVKEKKKEDWKKMIKEKINIMMNVEFKLRKVQSTKLRHLTQNDKGWGQADYLKELGISNATEVLKTRLEMRDIGRNFGKERVCKGCGEEETTEHLLECWEVRRKIASWGNTQWICEGNGKDLIKATKIIKEYLEWRDEQGDVVKE